MTNAEILSRTIDDWLGVIVTETLGNMAKKNQMTFFLSQLITPEQLMGSIRQHLVGPMIYDFIGRIPDSQIPPLSVSLLDGMIDTRKKNGALPIPLLCGNFTPRTFETLKEMCEKNFSEYSEKPEKKKKTTENE